MMAPGTRRAVRLALLAASCAAGAGCAHAPDSSPPPAAPPAPPARAGSLILGEEPWTLGSTAGRVVTTPSFRIFTTLDRGYIADRLPSFAESALARYRTAFGPLPAVPRPLDTYLLANRSQWMRVAAQVLGPAHSPFQQILRGGVTSGGRSVLYDIGPGDTFSLLGHEGWHQYVQSSFREPLPVWLDEGIATVMEGFRWRDDDPTEPEFLPWANLERFDQLRDAVNQGALTPLPDLLAGSPARSLQGGPEPALTYYAQVWALTMFLMEGEGGKHAPSLHALLADASRGMLATHIRASLEKQPAGVAVPRHPDAAAFLAYFGPDLGRVSDAYASFCAAATAPKARDAAALGRSPLPRTR